MHPAMMYWWSRARREAMREARASCGASCGTSGGSGGGGADTSDEDSGYERYEAASGEFGLGASFGVRRPLRFMAHHLRLNDDQVAALAKILNDLKTERAQAAVDHQRTISAFADAVTGESFDVARADEGLRLRVETAQRLRDEVKKALERTHAMLTPEQRQKLAYMLRSGALTI